MLKERYCHEDGEELLLTRVKRAMKATSHIDRFFWLVTLADDIRARPPDRQEHLFRMAARRIHAFYEVPDKVRQQATRFLAGSLFPVT